MAHTELDLRERRAIEDMLNAKVPVSKIAVQMLRVSAAIDTNVIAIFKKMKIVFKRPQDARVSAQPIEISSTGSPLIKARWINSASNAKPVVRNEAKRSLARPTSISFHGHWLS